MHEKIDQTSQRQRVFREAFTSILLYVAVLGFFNEYTDIVYTKSFSYLFIAASILGLLASGTFWLKGLIIARFGETRKLLMIVGVWLVMFLSKFIFVEAIDLVLGNDVNIYGYFGIVAVVLCATVAEKLANFVYEKL